MFVAIRQKINLFDRVIIAYFGTISVCILSLVGVVYAYPEKVGAISSILSNTIIMGIILGFFILAIKSKVNVFESFIEGAKGQKIAGILPPKKYYGKTTAQVGIGR